MSEHESRINEFEQRLLIVDNEIEALKSDKTDAEIAQFNNTGFFENNKIIEVMIGDKFYNLYRWEIDDFYERNGHAYDFSIIVFRSKYDQKNQKETIA